MTLFLSTFLLFALQLLGMTLLESLFILVDTRQFVPFIFLGLGCAGLLHLFKKAPAAQKWAEACVPLTLFLVNISFFFTEGPLPLFFSLFLAFLTLGFVVAGCFQGESLWRIYLVDMAGAIGGTAFYFLSLANLGGERALVALLAVSILVPLARHLKTSRSQIVALIVILVGLPILKGLPFRINFIYTRPTIRLAGENEQNDFKNAFAAVHSGRSEYLTSRWSPLGRVDLLRIKENGEHWFYYNNVTFTSTNKDLGDWLFPHRALPNMESALIVGSGGGNDLLQLKKLGFKNLTGLEINRGTTEIMNSSYIKEFNGDVFRDDQILNVDARAFLEKRAHQYAYITNTFTELVYERNSPTIFYQNYIYTVEGTEAIWDGLLPDGVALWLRTAEGNEYHGPDAYRTVLTIRDMLVRKGLDPRKHLVVVHNTERGQNIIWLKKDGWQPSDYTKYFSNLGDNNVLIFPTTDETANLTQGARDMRDILVEKISADDYFNQHGVKIDPVTDDRPYLYFHLNYDNWFYFYLCFAMICCGGFVWALLHLYRSLPVETFRQLLPAHFVISGLGFAAGLLQISLTYDTAFLFVHPTYSIVCIFIVWLSGGVIASFLYRRLERRWLWALLSAGISAGFILYWGTARLVLIRMDDWSRNIAFAALVLPIAVSSSAWFLILLEDCRRVSTRLSMNAYCMSSLSLVAGSGLCGLSMFHLGVRNSVYLAQIVFAVAFIAICFGSRRSSVNSG